MKREKKEPKAHKETIGRIDVPNLPIRFDPRWAQHRTCKEDCTPRSPCNHPIHGGYKIGVLAAHGPQPDWTEKLKSAICFCCHCPAGQKTCTDQCACHGDSEQTAVPPSLADLIRRERAEKGVQA